MKNFKKITSHIKEEKQGGKSYSIKYLDLLQKESNQDDMVLAEERQASRKGLSQTKTVMNRYWIIRGGTLEHWGKNVFLISGIVTITKMKLDTTYTH